MYFSRSISNFSFHQRIFRRLRWTSDEYLVMKNYFIEVGLNFSQSSKTNWKLSSQELVGFSQNKFTLFLNVLTWKLLPNSYTAKFSSRSIICRLQLISTICSNFHPPKTFLTRKGMFRSGTRVFRRSVPESAFNIMLFRIKPSLITSSCFEQALHDEFGNQATMGSCWKHPYHANNR